MSVNCRISESRNLTGLYVSTRFEYTLIEWVHLAFSMSGNVGPTY